MQSENKNNASSPNKCGRLLRLKQLSKFIFFVVIAQFNWAMITEARAQCPFNVSGAPTATLANDGVLLARVAREVRNAELVSKLSTTLSADTIVGNMAAVESKLDVNGSGAFDTDDAAIIANYIAGFRGDALIANGAGRGATRKTSGDIQSFIDGGCVATSPARKKLSVMKAEQMAQNNGGVFISVLDDVEIDTNVDLAWLEIQGSLVCSDRDLALSSRWILVHGGSFQCGTSLNPFAKRLTITLTGPASDESVLGMGMGTKMLGAMHGARIAIYGERRVSWTQLNATANVGATQIVLKEPVDWRVGEKIVIASTALDPDQAEERQILSVSADRRTVTLNQALAYSHFGQLQTFEGKTLDERAEVALLSRNIVIEGDDSSTTSQFGGHVMIMGALSTVRETQASKRSSAKLQGIEFRRMGQFDRLGRYPIHWHQNGDSAGDFVRSSSFHSNLQRGVVVHGTDNTTIESNTVLRSMGHSYALEDGTEKGNLLRGNLGLGTQPFPRKATNPIQAAQNDDRAATFWMKTGDNRFVGNYAAGGENVAFWFDDVGLVDQTKFEFTSNVAHSYVIDGNRGGDLCCDGFEKAALWFTGEGYDKPYRGPFPISKMTFYKNRTAMWGNPRTLGQGFADVRLSDSILADNIMGLNSHGAANTVIVGKSANTDTVWSIGAQGVQEYGHTQRLENVTFVNFADSSAIDHRNCAREAGNVTAINVKLVSARINLCGARNDRNVDLAIADVTGSVLGNGVPVTLTPIGSDSRAMYTTNCPINTALGVRVCNGLLAYGNLHQRGANASLTRDDGVQLNVSDVNDYPFYWTTIEGRRYTLNGNVASQPTIEFTMLGKYEDETRDRSVLVKLAATSAFAIYGVNANWFSPSTSGRSGMSLLPQSASLAALEASTASAYFYDSAARVIHLKIWTNGFNRVYIDRR
jgi:G8 domain